MPATCALANAVAELVVTKFRELSASSGVPCPVGPDGEGRRGVQAVVAGVVAMDVGSGDLWVVSVGSGTKYLPQRLAEANTEGLRVVDCHAEVLARRGLVARLYAEIMQLERGESRGGRGRWILEREPEVGESLEAGVDSSSARKPTYRVREGVVLHFYSSSMPCGNACIRRWATNSREVFRHDLGERGWPAEAHPRLHVVQRAQGQVAVTAKADSSVRDPTKEDTEDDKASGEPGREGPGSGVAGVSAVGGGRTATCSDKLARWGVLGLQGGLLSQLVPRPVRFATQTVGRKFSRPHLARAVCCRLQDFTVDAMFGKAEKRSRWREGRLRAWKEKVRKLEGESAEVLTMPDDNDKEREWDSMVLSNAWPLGELGHEACHPALMGTSVKLDHGVLPAQKRGGEGTLAEGAEGGYRESQDANFDDPRCLVWSEGGTPEVLDGTTGLLWNSTETSDDKPPDESDLMDASPSVSRRSLFATFAELRHVGSNQTYAQCKAKSEVRQVAKQLLLSDSFLAAWPKSDPSLLAFRL